mgnify:CR=1 FL=1
MNMRQQVGVISVFLLLNFAIDILDAKTLYSVLLRERADLRAGQ